MHVVFAYEISVLANTRKEEKYFLYGCDQDGFFYLVELKPAVPHGMVYFDSLLGGFDFEEEAVEGVGLEELNSDQTLVDVNDGLVVVKGNLEDIEYF